MQLTGARSTRVLSWCLPRVVRLLERIPSRNLMRAFSWSLLLAFSCNLLARSLVQFAAQVFSPNLLRAHSVAQLALHVSRSARALMHLALRAQLDMCSRVSRSLAHPAVRVPLRILRRRCSRASSAFGPYPNPPDPMEAVGPQNRAVRSLQRKGLKPGQFSQKPVNTPVKS